MSGAGVASRSERYGGIARDITQRKEMVAELAQHHDILQAILDQSPNGIMMVDRTGCIVATNRHVTTFFGLAPEEVMGLEITAFYDKVHGHFADKRQLGLHVSRLQEDPGEAHIEDGLRELFENTLRLVTPTPRNVAILARRVLDGEGEEVGRLWVMVDVTKYAQTEETIHKIVEVAPMPFVITRISDGTILFANDPLGKLVGLPPRELIGRKSPDFYHRPEDRALLLAELAKHGRVHNYEMLLTDARGEPFWGLVSLETSNVGGEPAIIGSIYDIDPRKRLEEELRQANRELKETQAQLVQSEKMASLGLLVAGVAHEINTPVAAISSMRDTHSSAMSKLRDRLGGQLADDARARRLFDMMQQADEVIGSGTERLTAIVGRLRRFARLDEAELKRVDLHEGLEDTLALIAHKLTERIEIVRQYGDLPAVSCFPRQLNQVFLNLLINACHPSAGADRITIATSSDEREVRVAIADNGGGIPAENLSKIFDPGFTTKGVGVGAGLGLSICYRIMRDHHGRIDVDSELGQGSTFTVAVPTNLRALLSG